MNKIIKGDQVVVITGKDKGKQGQVVRVLGSKVVVEGIERIKPNQKLALAAWKAPAVANHASSVETKTSITEGAQP